MIDTRFFHKAVDTLTLREICDLSGAELDNPDKGDVSVSSLAPLDLAGADDVSFLDNKKYIDDFQTTKARACFVRDSFAKNAPEDVICLISDNPYKAYALTAQAFFPLTGETSGISDDAVIDRTAEIGKNVTIESGAVIKNQVKIGDNSFIGANTVVEKSVEIGQNCQVGPLCCLSHCLIGNSVTLAAGVKIGQPGFGFAISKTGFVSVPQLGRVIIEDMVDIGANTTIDRGAIKDTIVRQGTRIDNLVQLGHNVETGEMCVLVSQAGVAGSTKLGDFVMIGGQVGIAGHLKVASGVKIGAQAGVMRDIDLPGEYLGSPAMTSKQFMRQVATLNKMMKPTKKGPSDNG
ncbi:MAG: UDP-3-O-(3-hydroxymyristoyl)glucosamine N-acyltransferase [Pseudomonadota bacterium]